MFIRVKNASGGFDDVGHTADTLMDALPQVPEVGDILGAPEYVEKKDFDTVVDHLWLLICAFIVFLMQAGFAMLEVGTVRSKNAKNLMIDRIG